MTKAEKMRSASAILFTRMYHLVADAKQL